METVFDFIINKKAFQVMAEGEQSIYDTIKKTLGPLVNNIVFIESERLESNLEDWLKDNISQPVSLFVGGGDGSFRTAAQLFSDRSLCHNKPLGFLPLGTCSNIAKQLGFSNDYSHVLKQFNSLAISKLSYATINGNVFFLIACLDANSILAFQSREALRNNEYFSWISKAIKSMVRVYGKNRDTLLRLDQDEEVEGRMFFISLRQLAPKPIISENTHLRTTSKYLTNVFNMSEGDAPPTLYCYVGGMTNLLSFTRSVFSGVWDYHHGIKRIKLSDEEKIRLTFSDSSYPHTIVLDGEFVEIDNPIEFQALEDGLLTYRAP